MGFLKWLLGLSPSFLVGVVVFAMLNFFVPQRLISKINIANLDQKTAKRMWLAMIGAVSLLFGMFVVDLYNSGLKPKFDSYIHERDFRKLLAEQITKDEMIILKYFLDKEDLSLCTDRYNHKYKWGALKTLERDGIIYLSDTYKKEDVFCYAIERWAYFYLKDNPTLLGLLATEGPT